MSSTSRVVRRTLPFIVIAALLMAGAAALRMSGAASAPATIADTPRPKLPTQYLRLVSFGFDELVADVLWIRFLQNIPTTKPSDANTGWLVNQAESVAALDPSFQPVYKHGATVIGVLAYSPGPALKLMEHGVERSPDDWLIPFLAGYMCFYELRDLACGAEYMRIVTTIPHSPPWAVGLTGRLIASSGDPDGAVEFLYRWKQGCNREADPKLCDEIDDRFKRAILRRDIYRISEAAFNYHTEKQVWPDSVATLIAGGHLKYKPIEPFGAAYEIDDGLVTSTSGEEALGVHFDEFMYTPPPPPAATPTPTPTGS